MKLKISPKSKDVVITIRDIGPLYEYDIDHPDFDGYGEEYDEVYSELESKIKMLISYSPRSFEEAMILADQFLNDLAGGLKNVSTISLREFLSELKGHYPNNVEIIEKG